jgi:hypothetical protein
VRPHRKRRPSHPGQHVVGPHEAGGMPVLPRHLLVGYRSVNGIRAAVEPNATVTGARLETSPASVSGHRSVPAEAIGRPVRGTSTNRPAGGDEEDRPRAGVALLGCGMGVSTCAPCRWPGRAAGRRSASPGPSGASSAARATALTSPSSRVRVTPGRGFHGPGAGEEFVAGAGDQRVAGASRCPPATASPVGRQVAEAHGLAGEIARRACPPRSRSADAGWPNAPSPG